jgi:signal transduction histidine kinase
VEGRTGGGHGHDSPIGRVLLDFGLPALAFSLGAGFATRNWLTSIITGLAISGAICLFSWLDHRFLHPHLKKLSQDWLRLGLETTLTLFDHILGALVTLFICSSVLGLELVPWVAWIPVAGMVIAFPIIHGTEMALRYFRRLQDQQRQEAQLRALAAEAELKALKAQLNPHFLFNTLNTIAQLIHSDSDKAEDTVERLAEMLRHVLNGSGREWVPLSECLSFLDNYLEVERARFGQRLRIRRQIDPEALDVPVPSLLLQPLVENAVRHGSGADGSIDLGLRVDLDGDEVEITIMDQGAGMPRDHEVQKGLGYGLPNVKERLRLTYGEKYGLAIRDNEPNGTVVTVRIPAGTRT